MLRFNRNTSNSLQKFRAILNPQSHYDYDSLLSKLGATSNMIHRFSYSPIHCSSYSTTSTPTINNHNPNANNNLIPTTTNNHTSASTPPLLQDVDLQDSYPLRTVFNWGDQYLTLHFPSSTSSRLSSSSSSSLNPDQENEIFEQGHVDFHDESLQLLAHVLNMDYKECKRALYDARSGRIGEGGILLSRQQYENFSSLIKLRAHTHQPLQYLTGQSMFFGREFFVNDHVLIPRMDSEVLIESTLHHIRHHMKDSVVRILDIGTGSGCLITTLLCELSNDTDHHMVTGMALDISFDALQVARKNANRLLSHLNRNASNGNSSNGSVGVDGGGGSGGGHRKHRQVEFVHQDVFKLNEQQLEEIGSFNVIVSNPPYIRSSVIPQLSREVKEHEPIRALDGGQDGLDFYRHIVRLCDETALLDDGGLLALEIGYDQSHNVRQLILQSHKMRLLSVDKDLGGVERVIIALKRVQPEDDLT